MNKESSNYYPRFSMLLEGYLEKQDRSQAWLAKRLDVHHGTVSRWLTQGTRPNNPEMVIQIADLLGVYRFEERQRLLIEAGYSIAPNVDSQVAAVDTDVHQPSGAYGTSKTTKESGDADAAWQTKIDSRLGSRIRTRLFGIEGYVTRLERLLDADHIGLIGLYGMGGVGKTTLADYVVRLPSIGQRFKDIAWVDIKQHEFISDEGVVKTGDTALDVEGIVESLCAQLGVEGYKALSPQPKEKALFEHLNSKPHLIVLDNFEERIREQTLLPFLLAMTHSSKIIITSRYMLPCDSEIFQLRVDCLLKEDSMALLWHLIKLTGSAAPLSKYEKQLAQIYDKLGGNPLALRLIASQIRILELPTVLESLTEVPDDDIDTFYGYLFRSSWNLLAPESQTLLSLMPLVDKATRGQLDAISAFGTTDLNTALRQLVRMSFLEVRGDLEKKRYFIHRLTETFLLKESLIRKWGSLDAIQFSLGNERNLEYWHKWLEQTEVNVALLDIEWPAIVKAIRFGLELPDIPFICYSLIEQLSPYMERRGHWASWSQILEKAIATTRADSDSVCIPQLSLSRARLLRYQSRYQEAVSEFQRTVRLSKQAADRITKARAWSNLGHLYIELDHWWRAEILCVHALQIFEDTEHPHGRAHTHNHLGILYTRQSRWDDAWHHLLEALNLWQGMDDRQCITVANLNLGKLANDMRMQGADPQRPARPYLEQAIFYGEQSADEVAVGVAKMNMGIVHKLDGRPQEAEITFRTSAEIFDRYGDTLNAALIADNLGVVCGDQGRKEEAMSYFQKSLGLWRKLESSYGEFRTLLYLTEWEYRLGSQEVARNWLTEAGQLLTRNGHREKYHSLFGKYQKLSSSLS